MTPSLNQGEFIRDTIESVLSQDYPNLEYIVMDGGSTDDTASIVSQYAGRLIWISEADRGQAHAVNKGWRLARGEILGWLNSDDMLLPGAISAAVSALLEDPRLGGVYGDGYFLDRAGDRTELYTPPSFNQWDFIHRMFGMLQPTVFIRRRARELAGDLDEHLHWAMDFDFFMRVGQHTTFRKIDGVLAGCRTYPTNKTNAGGYPRVFEVIRVFRRHSRRRLPASILILVVSALGETIEGALKGGRVAWARQGVVRVREGLIGKLFRRARTWYEDGWAGPHVNLLFPASGDLVVAGCVPDLDGHLQGQELEVRLDGRRALHVAVPVGDFEFRVPLDHQGEEPSTHVELRASRHFVPRRVGMNDDSRRLSYLLREARWDAAPT